MVNMEEMEFSGMSEGSNLLEANRKLSVPAAARAHLWSPPRLYRQSAISMAHLSFIQYLLSLLFFLNAVTAQTLTNFTIDNTNANIAYVGVWDPSASHTSALDIGGSHTLSEDRTGSATFSFTGVAVYYLAPKWPYTVNSYVAIDGGSPVLVDMTAPPQNSPNGEETVAADVLWSATGLTSGNHKVVVTVGPAGYAVVDGFIYTTQSGGSSSQVVSTVFTTSTVQPSTTSARTSSSSTSTSTDPTTPTQSNSTVIIAVTVSASVVGLVLLIGLIIFFVRRSKKTDEADRYSATYGYGGGGGGGGSYTIPASGANTYSAVPLTENAAYPYPYDANAGAHSHGMAGSGMMMGELGSRDSRYSVIGYSEGTNSASLGGSLSGQQMAHANAPLYNQDAYGLYPVSNRALVVPSVVTPSAGARYNAAGVGSSSAGYNKYSGGGAGGYNAAPATYITRPLSTSSDLPPGAAAPVNQPPSPSSEKARFEGAYNQAYDAHSLQVKGTPGASGSSPTMSHGHTGSTGAAAPPPYADQHGGSGSSPRVNPGSPPRTKKGFI